MSLSRPIKYLTRFLLALLLLGLLLFGALVAWVVTGPRSLSAFTPYIESALTPKGSGYKAKVQGCILIWDGWLHPVGIHLENVDMLDGKDALIAHFPEVGVRMYFFELLIGKVDIKSIELIRPTATLVQDAHGNIASLGFSAADAGPSEPVADTLEMLTSEKSDNPITHLKSFTIHHAALSVKDAQGKVFLSSPDASIEIVRTHGSAQGKLSMPLQFDGKHSEINSKFVVNGNSRTVASSMTFKDVPSAVLHAMAPTQQWMDGVKVPLSGDADMTSDFSGNISAINFTLDAGPGTIEFPSQFEQVMKPQHIHLAGMLGDQLNTVTIKEGLLDFGAASISFNGVVHRQGDDYGADAFAQTQNIPVDDIHRYWPLKLAPHSRKWVVTRLSKGKVAKANVALHFKPGEFKLKDTPDAAIDSTIVVKGTTVTYKTTHPPITDIDGTVRFTGRTMDAKIASARYLNGTHIMGARVRFPDFYPDDVRLFLDLDVEAPGKDVQQFLALPDLNKATKLGLTDRITGQATGNAKLDFIAFSENDKDDVAATGKINYAIDASLINVSQDRFMGERDVDNANMKLSVDNKGIKTSGKARINGLPMDIDLTSNFVTDVTTYKIITDMPVARLPDFGLPKLDFAKGVIGANATFVSSDKAEKAEAALDLTRASISLPQHGFFKKDGDKVSLKLATERLPNGNTLISPFTLKGEGYNASGKAEYDKATQDFRTFSFSPLKVGKQDLDSLDYEKFGNTVKLAAAGRVFDASPYLNDKSGKSGNLAYVIDLRTKLLILGDSREMGDVTVLADCPADACRLAQIKAKLRDGTSFLYAIGDGKLSASCDNAGELVRTFGIFDTIEGGNMTMTGQYNNGTLAGELDVTGYTLKRAPVLTKIFTVASLTGILDTLTGNGIYFKKLTAPFQYHGGAIVLKDAKSHGSALGLTADGVIDTGKSTLDITGVLVPSYTLNSLVGNIPLLGDLITGGNGKGLVALNYSVRGDMKDPSVRVNPLSVLTPGFLREIFSIFDTPAPDMEAIKAAQQKAVGDKTTIVPVQPVVNPAVPPAPAVAPAVAAPSALPALPKTTSDLPAVDELQK